MTHFIDKSEMAESMNISKKISTVSIFVVTQTAKPNDMSLSSLVDKKKQDYNNRDLLDKNFILVQKKNIMFEQKIQVELQ
jgi:hypothetical protein